MRGTFYIYASNIGDQPLNVAHCLSATDHYHYKRGHLAGRRDDGTWKVNSNNFLIGIHFTFQTMQLYRSYILVYSILLHVSAVYFSHHRIGILVHSILLHVSAVHFSHHRIGILVHSTLLHVSAAHFSHHRIGKLVRKKRHLLTNSGYKVIVKFLIIINPKTEQ